MIIELIGNINKKKFNRKNGGEIEAIQLNQEIDRWKMMFSLKFWLHVF